MEKAGLNEGIIDHELLDDEGNVVAIIDLAWPKGIQNGLTADTQAIVSKHGYRYYTDVSELKDYITASYQM